MDALPTRSVRSRAQAALKMQLRARRSGEHTPCADAQHVTRSARTSIMRQGGAPVSKAHCAQPYRQLERAQLRPAGSKIGAAQSQGGAPDQVPVCKLMLTRSSEPGTRSRLCGEVLAQTREFSTVALQPSLRAARQEPARGTPARSRATQRPSALPASALARPRRLPRAPPAHVLSSQPRAVCPDARRLFRTLRQPSSLRIATKAMPPTICALPPRA